MSVFYDDEPLSEATLAAIEERCGAASPGEWIADGTTIATGDPGMMGREEDIIAEDVVRTADAVFMAHAREDVPALLAMVETLTAKLAEAERAHRLADAAHGETVFGELATANATIDSLAARLGALTKDRDDLQRAYRETDQRAKQLFQRVMQAEATLTELRGMIECWEQNVRVLPGRASDGILACARELRARLGTAP